MAQLVARPLWEREAVGSSPATPTGGWATAVATRPRSFQAPLLPKICRGMFDGG